MEGRISLGRWLLFWLFPRKCPVCRKVIPPQQMICPGCREALPHNETAPPSLRYLHGLSAPYRYQAGVQKVVSAFKFRGRRELAPMLAQAMDQTLPVELRPELVIGVPMHPSRRRQRGYNQADLLARELGRIRQVPSSTTALVKYRNNRLQHHLSAGERRANVKDVYQVRDAAQVAGKTVLLVDDVFTTGSTLEECARVLRQAGARQVWGVVYARVQDVGMAVPQVTVSAEKQPENAALADAALAKRPPDTV